MKRQFSNIRGVLVPKLNVSSFYDISYFIQKENREDLEELSRTTLQFGRPKLISIYIFCAYGFMYAFFICL